MMHMKPSPLVKPEEIVLSPCEEPKEGNERPKVRLLYEIKRYKLA
jgi:hypothetical protein